ncbi:MAG TPA: PilZ domain-containing protein [Anaerohalosphaeraceae bacterium]|nr:PilZ domain-containing protein [Anaerohalosphaeraceae bacterium]HOM76699.1 PilZ domain-containing protein [Anaerohalosphaeraceae bacterium]HPC65313.1 PilZ domain-containing protein [Anaerohalosphaeraceae bacterium]HPO70061.1 PilZ domain-containing protein [Anaerohalosphaeraceae bacterium]HRS70994.1 PilZ domain-containing protein [Anaerohalosphaeraceae bacterium]
MNSLMERRREERLRYSWPVWFAEDFDDILTQGQMVDISSRGAAFTCYADRCPTNGEMITARFSVPKFEDSDSFDMENFIRDGRICRIDELGPYIRRVAIQFSEPLPFNPAACHRQERLVCV